MSKETGTKPDLGVRSNPHVHKAGAELWENRDATGDIKFKVEGVEISAHKLILAALSPKFKRQFYGDFDDKDKKVIEVNEECVSAAAFEEFLQFFYLDKVHLRHENIGGVLFLTKESLVEEFYDVCVKYLLETLSIDNVVLSYGLASLHECSDLIKSCEHLIRSKTMEVFTTDAFINCNRSTLSKILQLVPQNCKATDIFEACISWAKQYSTLNGLNVENNEHLREAIGDVLYRINFGKMTMEEFMKYYTPHKTLFTDEEREEIFCMIGKASDFKPKWFVDSTKLLSSNSSVEVETQTVRKWDEEAAVKCNIENSLRTGISIPMRFLKLPFSCNREVLLGGFFCHPEGQGTITTNITVEIYSLVGSDDKVLYSETKPFTFHRGQKTYIKLDSPFLIKTESKYFLKVKLDGIQIQFFQNSIDFTVTLNKNTIVTVSISKNHERYGISGLMLNI